MASPSKGGITQVAARSEMEKMNLDQLKALKEQVDLEVNLLQDSLNNIRTAITRLDIASSALNDLSLRPKGSHNYQSKLSLSYPYMPIEYL